MIIRHDYLCFLIYGSSGQQIPNEFPLEVVSHVKSKYSQNTLSGSHVQTPSTIRESSCEQDAWDSLLF